MTGFLPATRRWALTAIAAGGIALAGGAGPVADAGTTTTAPPWAAKVSRLSANQIAGLRSWRPGCPVHPSDLRLVAVRHFGLDGRFHVGRLLVHERAAHRIVAVFKRLYRARFPIRRMRLIDHYSASDYRSIEDDNTSAFNCRRATGSGRWSMHAYGLAIDLNPLENPYVAGGRTSHPRSRPYLDRRRRLPGMVRAGDVVVRAFASVGWGWGGAWSGGVRDYQHFSSNGR